MKFSIGDKVILKRTGEEGIVTDFIGKDMLEVSVNGTHFPVYADEVDHPYLKWFTDKNRSKKKASVPEQLPVEKEKQRPVRLAKGIYLSFMPVFRANEVDDIVEQLKIYLINETSTQIRYHYDVRFFHQSDFRLEGTLHPFGHLFLHTVDYADMNDQPRFHWQLSDAGGTGMKEEEGVLRVRPAKLFEHINDLLTRNEPTFAYLLVEEFVPRPKNEKTRERYVPEPLRPAGTTPGKLHSFADLPRFEVDLHIEHLVSDFKGMSNAEIMHIQLQHLQRYLHLAIVHRLERMIVIHGLGSGALRDAVHALLKQSPEVERYRNEYMGRYGFGATEVTFRR